jgi:uncharacterized protein (TIGR03083 family)
MKTDYLQLMLEESRDLATLLDGLDHEQWHAPSLCAGWRVKDVVAHMAVGHSMSVLAFGAAVVRHRFSVDATSLALARSFADRHSEQQVLELFVAGTSGPPRAAARFVPVHELFTDHLVHHQDIRRPLGLPRDIPSGRLLAALESLPRLSSRVGSRKRMSGLRVVATDVEFDWGGSGPELRGPAEALVMTLTGRRAALEEISGPGVEVLATRLSGSPQAPASRAVPGA